MSTFSSSFVQYSEVGNSTMELPSTSSARPSESPNNNFDYSKVPPEVWKEILHRIEDPDTFQNCSKASNQFREILLSERATQLFPLVLPFINDYFSLKDLLSCRQACKRWKDGMENYLPLNPSWKNGRRAFDLNPEKERWVSPLGNTFYKVNQLNTFLSSMENCSGNPFPTRTLIFFVLQHPQKSRNRVLLEVQDKEELFTSFLSLLRKFGKEIHTFVFITDHMDHLQAWMQQIIKLLPNLKKLRLKVLNNDPWGLQVFSEGWDWFKHLKPLPSHLISLHVGPFYSSKVTASILESIGDQLEYLGCEAATVEELTYFKSPTHPWFIREMPNLRELNLTRTNLMRGRNEPLILGQLARLRLPKLEKLTYNPKEGDWQREIPFKLVLQLINQFAPTLEELKLTMPLERMVEGEVFGEEDPEAALVGVPVPKLKRLGIRYTMVDHPLLEGLLDKFTSLEKVRLHQYKIVRRWDFMGHGKNEKFIIRPTVLQKMQMLDGLVKTTTFKTIDLLVKGGYKKHLYTLRRT